MVHPVGTDFEVSSLRDCVGSKRPTTPYERMTSTILEQLCLTFPSLYAGFRLWKVQWYRFKQWIVARILQKTNTDQLVPRGVAHGFGEGRRGLRFLTPLQASASAATGSS